MIHNSLSHVLLILVDNLSQIKFINMEKKILSDSVIYFKAVLDLYRLNYFIT